MQNESWTYVELDRIKNACNNLINRKHEIEQFIKSDEGHRLVVSAWRKRKYPWYMKLFGVHKYEYEQIEKHYYNTWWASKADIFHNLGLINDTEYSILSWNITEKLSILNALSKSDNGSFVSNDILKTINKWSDIGYD